MKIKSPIVFQLGDSHADCIESLQSYSYIEGFITDTNQIVNREEAAEIAYNAGQIKTKVNQLFSYMLKG